MQGPVVQDLSHEIHREAIWAQLHRLLASPFFSNSKRYPALLRYVVHKTLEGRTVDLKERSLGIEVFGRAADYDTNNDPVVRVTAGEIRKRLAQYYCEPEHENELRIDLPPGSYIPEFRFPAKPPEPQAETPSSAAAAVKSRSHIRSWAWVSAVVSVVALAVIGYVAIQVQRDPIRQFWGPVVGSSKPVLICVGQPDFYTEGRAKAVADQRLGYRMLNLDRIVMGDAVAISRVSGLLGKAGVPFSLQGSDTTTYVDMRRGPVVVVSGGDNVWTLRLTEKLRFHFVVGQSLMWIEDRQQPARRDWAVDFNSPYTSLTQDYAIVARFFDTATGQPSVVAAGIGVNGTMSASEFLTDPSYLDALMTQLPARARHKNIEAVLATQVIDGKSGPPKILAVHYW